MSFTPAAMHFDGNRQAALFLPGGTEQDARRCIEATAVDWPIAACDADGVYVLPAGGIPVAEFAAALLALGDGWELRPLPDA